MSAPLLREVLRIAEEVITGLDELARVTGLALAREVPRSAVVLAIPAASPCSATTALSVAPRSVRPPAPTKYTSPHHEIVDPWGGP